jgi:hypothetical protein
MSQQAILGWGSGWWADLQLASQRRIRAGGPFQLLPHEAFCPPVRRPPCDIVSSFSSLVSCLSVSLILLCLRRICKFTASNGCHDLRFGSTVGRCDHQPVTAPSTAASTAQRRQSEPTDLSMTARIHSLSIVVIKSKHNARLAARLGF